MKVRIEVVHRKDAELIAKIVLEALGYTCFDSSTKSSLSTDTINKVAELVEQEDTLHSWKNARICKIEDTIVGGIIAYDGSEYQERFNAEMPILARVLNLDLTNFQPEAIAGEFYIDSITILPEWRKKGLGGLLLKHAIQLAREKQLKSTSLLVSQDNPKAQSLYQKTGFMPDGFVYTYNERFIKLKYSLQ